MSVRTERRRPRHHRRSSIDRRRATRWTGRRRRPWRTRSGRSTRTTSASVAVLYGAGGTFCAGADLKAMDNRIEDDGDGPMGPTRLRLSKPVVAAIEGYAVAGGLELAAWCDLRVAAEDAVLGVFCRRWGVPLIDGGTVRLPRLIGTSRALDLVLTGRPVPADEAERIGLVNRVVPSGGAREAAEQLASELARVPPAVSAQRPRVGAGPGGCGRGRCHPPRALPGPGLPGVRSAGRRGPVRVRRRTARALLGPLVAWPQAHGDQGLRRARRRCRPPTPRANDTTFSCPVASSRMIADSRDHVGAVPLGRAVVAVHQPDLGRTAAGRPATRRRRRTRSSGAPCAPAVVTMATSSPIPTTIAWPTPGSGGRRGSGDAGGVARHDQRTPARSVTKDRVKIRRFGASATYAAPTRRKPSRA